MVEHRSGGHSSAARACLPALSGRLDPATTARVRQMAEDPSTTTEDLRQLRAEYAAEQARRREANAQLDRDLQALTAALAELPQRGRRP